MGSLNDIMGSLIAIISFLIIITAYVSFTNKTITLYSITSPQDLLSLNLTALGNKENIATSNVFAVVFLIALLIGVLLLPSLKTIKLGQIELDTASIDPDKIQLEPTLITMMARTAITSMEAKV
jgi:hypothetical protein